MPDLKTLQEELDVKKWYDSVKQHRDMCGEYSYCAYCTDMYQDEPCAKAYLKEEEKTVKPVAPRPRRVPKETPSAKEQDAERAKKPKKTSSAKTAETEVAAASAPKPKRTSKKKA